MTRGSRAALGVSGTLLDIERKDHLIEYLRKRGALAAEEEPDITLLSGGVSSKVVLLRRANGESWVLKQALSRLRVAVPWYSNPARTDREAAAIRLLSDLLAPGYVPRLVFEDSRHHLLAMEAAPEPHVNLKVKLLAGAVSRRDLMMLAELLATIHAESYRRRGEVPRLLWNRRYFESLRVEPYFIYTARAIPKAAKFLEELLAELRANQLALVHGDFSPKNVLIHRNGLILLDHEVAHVGDPAFDLGFALSHLLSKAHHLPAVRDPLAEGVTGFWHSYRSVVGEVDWMRDLEGRSVRAMLACLLARVAGRSQLEYLDSDERLRQRRAVVEILPMGYQTFHSAVPAFIEAISIG